MKTLAHLDKLKAEVFNKQTVLARIFEQYSQTSIFDYVNSWPVPKTVHAEEFDIFLKHVQALLAETYGDKKAAAAVQQLRQSPVVSTIDHHGLLNHPFFVNSNLIYSLRRPSSILICLTTGGISLNNSSWPGCLVRTQKDKLVRYSFFPDKLKTGVVLATPSLCRHNVQAAMARIRQDGTLEAGARDLTTKLAEELFLTDSVLSLPSFSGQACMLSSELWAKIFPSAPEIAYLPVELLVSRIISHEICPDSKHVLHRLLFTEAGWRLVEKYFQGSLGAFSSKHKGSFLFWGIDSKHRRRHLHRDKTLLKDGDFSIGLTPGEITRAQELNLAYPTSLVCFLTLLYYGITCLGGFNQVNWLTDIKERFLQLLAEIGEDKVRGGIMAAETKNFAEGNLAFLLKDNMLIKAGGLDIYLEQDSRLYAKYQGLAKRVTVGESIESLLPEIYRVITPGPERDEDCMSITDEQIAEYNGLERKIRDALAV